MRYTRRALLVFGGGLAFAFVVVVGEIHSLERLAAAVMVLGIAALPVAMAIDWRRGARALRVLERGAPAPRPRAAKRRATAPTGRKPPAVRAPRPAKRGARKPRK